MVSVRLAKIADLSDIVAFAARKLSPGSSTYDGIPFNAVIARRTAKRAMTDPQSRVWVSVRNDKIVGLLIVEVGEMPMSHYMAAQDLAFLADAGGDKLIDAALAWLRLLKNVARLDMAISASGPRKAFARLFRRKGMSEGGGLYYINLLNENSLEVAA